MTVGGLLPSTDTFLSAPLLQKPIQRPSGEKKGLDAPSVPAIALAAGWSSGRRYSICRSPATAVNAMDRPSADHAIVVRLGRPSTVPKSMARACRRSAGAIPMSARVTPDRPSTAR